MQLGDKLKNYIKTQATSLLQPEAVAPAAPSAPVADGDEDHEGQVLVSAMVGALYMGCAADGEITDEEYDAVKKTFRDVSEGLVSDEGFDELFDQAAELIDEEGFDVAIADIAANVPDREQRYSVLTMTMAACLADGQPDDSEQELIHAMAEAFGISQQDLEQYYTEVGQQVA